jgi:hypothetical protein
MKKDEWLQKFGACTAIENTPDTFMNLAKEYDLGSGLIFLWSELANTCGEEDYFAGTQWTEIVSGVHPHASRHYRREKPYIGFWVLVCGDITGPHNRNFYHCERCGYGWVDEYPGAPDDDCDNCGRRHCSPWRTEELDADGNVIAVG